MGQPSDSRMTAWRVSRDLKAPVAQVSLNTSGSAADRAGKPAGELAAGDVVCIRLAEGQVPLLVKQKLRIKLLRREPLTKDRI
jgi:hypothetical protein